MPLRRRTFTRTRVAIAGALAGLAVLAACSVEPSGLPNWDTYEREVDGLRITGVARQALLREGDSTAVRFTLLNTRADTARIDYHDGCFWAVKVYEADGTLVHPKGDGCTQAVTRLRIPPGGTMERTIHLGTVPVKAGQWPVWVDLPPGEYVVVSEVTSEPMDDQHRRIGEPFTIRSNPVRVTVLE